MIEFADLGIHLGVVVIVVQMTEMIKEKIAFKNKKNYRFIIILLSFLFSIFEVKTVELRAISLSTILHFFFSTMFYDLVVQYIKKKKESGMKAE